jgi:rhodanese-related sulfurtransferase
MDATKMTTRNPRQPRGLLALWQSGAILLLAVISGLLTNQWRPDRLPLMASYAPENPSVQTAENGLRISVEEAQGLFFARAALFVDTRPREFYELGHIQDARSLPLEDFDKRFKTVLGDVGPDIFIVTYCDGESCHSSKLVALELLEKGCMKVHVLENGWTLWQQQHLPVAVGPGPETHDNTAAY